MYPAELVAPMKADLTNIGFKELLTPEDVDQVLDSNEGTTFLVINSVCGCAAGSARPQPMGLLKDLGTRQAWLAPDGAVLLLGWEVAVQRQHNRLRPPRLLQQV